MLMFKREKLRNKKGYTLTELLVVIAILGVLAAIASPMVMGYINDARVRADAVSAQTIENAVRASISRNGNNDIGVSPANGALQTHAGGALDNAYIRTAIGGYFNGVANIPVPQQTGFEFYLNTATGEVAADDEDAGADWIQVAPAL